MRLYGIALLGMMASLSTSQTLLGTLNRSDSGVPVRNDLRRVIGYTNGFYTVTHNGRDVLISRYNTSGTLVATARWSNPEGDVAQVFDAKIDTPGNIYVAMGGPTIASANTMFYVKFNALIQVQFERRVNNVTGVQLQLTPGGLGMLVGNGTSNPVVHAYAGNGNALWNANLLGSFSSTGLGLDNSLWIGGKDSSGSASLIKRNYLNGQVQAGWLSAGTNTPNNITAISTDVNGVMYAFGRVVEQSTSFLKLIRWVNGTFTEYRITTGAGTFTRAQITPTHVFVGATDANTLRVLKSNPSQATTIFSGRGTPFAFDPVSNLVFERDNGSLIHRSNADFVSQGTTTPTHDPQHMVRTGTTGGVLIGGNVESNVTVSRLTRISSTSSVQWTEDINDTGFARHTPVAQEIGNQNELYDTGYSLDFPTLSAPYINRISNSGALVWSVRPANLTQVNDIAFGGTLVFVSGMNQSTPVVQGYNRTTGAFVFSKNLTDMTDTAGNTVGIVANSDDSCAVLGNFGTTGNLRMKVISLRPDRTELARTTLGPAGIVAKQIENSYAGHYFAISEDGSAFRVQHTGAVDWTVLQPQIGRYAKLAVNPNSPVIAVAYQPNLSGFYTYWRVQKLNQSNGLSTQQEDIPQADSFASLDVKDSGETLISIRGGTSAGRIFTLISQSVNSLVDLPTSDNFVRWAATGQPIAIGERDMPTREIWTTLIPPALGFDRYIAKKINPPGVGLDSKAYNTLVAFNGTIWTVATMERRGQGRVVLYSRWRIDDEAPVALNDAKTLQKGTTNSTAAPGVMANDFDVNQDAFTAELVMAPTQGTFTLNADGSYSYTAPNTAGFWHAVYRVRQANGKVSNEATLQFTVTN